MGLTKKMYAQHYSKFDIRRSRLSRRRSSGGSIKFHVREVSGVNFSGRFDHLHGDQRDQAHDGATDKWDAIIDHPQQTADGGQKNGRNVIDGKSDCHARRNIPGISYLLKIGADGDGKIEKNMI